MSASSDSSSPRSTSGAANAPVSIPLEDGATPSGEVDVCATCRKRRKSCPKYPRVEDASEKGLPLYTLGEEIANSITHGIGVLLAIAGLVLLIVKAALGGAEPTHIASAIVFGVTLILEYLANVSSALSTTAASTCLLLAAIRRFASLPWQTPAAS